MTRPRATGPGPRTVAHPRVTSSAVGLLLVLLVAACGTSTVGPTAGPSSASSPVTAGGSPALAGPPVSASGAPGGSPATGGSAAPDPSQPRWPGTTVLAVIALGAADGEIQKAGNDLQAAAEAQDLKAMWGASDGLAKMIDGLMPNIDRLEVYEGTRPAAALYRKAFPELSAGARKLRDAITGGDASGIVAGSQEIAQGLADYAPVRQLIGGLVEQAIVQQRLLLQ